jgi:hypothetical protein
LQQRREADEELKRLQTKIRAELANQAKLKMCTIGSSHKMHGEDDPFILSEPPLGKTVAIIDAAGCIPAYELLGLSQHASATNIKSIVLVGDVHQLPPYLGYDGTRKRKTPPSKKIEVKKLHSLLDVSRLTVDDAKVDLTTQYRVPRDIADLLKTRIYNGQYNTAETAQVPKQGFCFIDVPFMESKRKRYVNDNEVEKVVELVRRCDRDGIVSIMVLTPVSPTRSKA